jgi:hypothetical protein
MRGRFKTCWVWFHELPLFVKGEDIPEGLRDKKMWEDVAKIAVNFQGFRGRDLGDLGSDGCIVEFYDFRGKFHS